MTEQPEALRLADALDDLMDSVNCGFSDIDKAAAELRRLHSVNVQLLEALEFIAGHDLSGASERATSHIAQILVYSARAAIAAAKGDA